MLGEVCIVEVNRGVEGIGVYVGTSAMYDDFFRLNNPVCLEVDEEGNPVLAVPDDGANKPIQKIYFYKNNVISVTPLQGDMAEKYRSIFE